LLAGALLAYALSFDELIVTIFTAGHEVTLPIWLLNQLSRPRDAAITNVVAMMVMLITAIPNHRCLLFNARHRKYRGQ